MSWAMPISRHSTRYRRTLAGLLSASRIGRTIARSTPLLQQRLSLLEVSSVKALGKPVVDRRQQLIGFSMLALALPQARQTHGCPQFQGLGLLATGDVQGPL